MSESALWRTTRNAIGPFGVLHRVENRVADGTPDVAYVVRVPSTGAVGSGWIELKHVPRWPVKANLTIPKLEKEQVDFALAWSAAGGRSFALIQVAFDYVLVDAMTLAAIFSRALPGAGVRDRAIAFGHRAFPAGDILRALTQ